MHDTPSGTAILFSNERLSLDCAKKRIVIDESIGKKATHKRRFLMAATSLTKASNFTCMLSTCSNM